jgi:hypothetical protein
MKYFLYLLINIVFSYFIVFIASIKGIEHLKTSTITRGVMFSFIWFYVLFVLGLFTTIGRNLYDFYCAEHTKIKTHKFPNWQLSAITTPALYFWLYISILYILYKLDNSSFCLTTDNPTNWWNFVIRDFLSPFDRSIIVSFDFFKTDIMPAQYITKWFVFLNRLIISIFIFKLFWEFINFLRIKFF